MLVRRSTRILRDKVLPHLDHPMHIIAILLLSTSFFKFLNKIINATTKWLAELDAGFDL